MYGYFGILTNLGFRIDTQAEANCTARYDTKVFFRARLYGAGCVIGAC